MMNIRKLTVGSAALLVLGAVGIAAVTTGAKKASACQEAVDIGLTVKSGNTIKGSGSWTRCNKGRLDTIQITLYEGLGKIPIRRDRVTFSPTPFGSHSASVSASCKGHGTDVWYTEITASSSEPRINRNAFRKESNRIKVTC